MGPFPDLVGDDEVEDIQVWSRNVKVDGQKLRLIRELGLEHLGRIDKLKFVPGAENRAERHLGKVIRMFFFEEFSEVLPVIVQYVTAEQQAIADEGKPHVAKAGGVRVLSHFHADPRQRAPQKTKALVVFVIFEREAQIYSDLAVQSCQFRLLPVPKSLAAVVEIFMIEGIKLNALRIHGERALILFCLLHHARFDGELLRLNIQTARISGAASQPAALSLFARGIQLIEMIIVSFGRRDDHVKSRRSGRLGAALAFLSHV
mmetsp:Transcript_10510/g.24513  ORF Transcript_10510/g.24513 Transcript_10510/m.24513 type:complete len:261 (-) Transcript_10510:104-886(-)